MWRRLIWAWRIWWRECIRAVALEQGGTGYVEFDLECGWMVEWPDADEFLGTSLIFYKAWAPIVWLRVMQ